jgi:SAM-dependent methyltransferase
MTNASTAYDQHAYPGFPYAQTHPDRLAMLGLLHGLEVVPVERCRVLELGCAEGQNLIPMALQLPGSRFVGIDRTEAAIAKGRTWIAELGLSNVQLLHQNVLDFEIATDAFDYVIAHGFYSWVPPAVQDRFFEIVRQGLSRNGIAFVSYNVLPGGYFRLMLREMMQFHTRSLPSLLEKAEQGRALVAFLIRANKDPSPYTSVLAEGLQRYLDKCPELVMHDELSECNEHLYFHEFAARAGRHGLQFLAEAEFAEMFPLDLEPGAVKLLDQLEGDVLAREQYLDFIKGRRFRQTLLCHTDVLVQRKVLMPSISRLHFAGNARPTAPLFQPDVGTPVPFEGSNLATMTTGHPLVKAALHRLAECWPSPLSWDEVRRQACEHLASLGIPASRFDGEEDQLHLLRTLFLGFGAQILQFHACALRMAVKPGKRPLASPLARLQLEAGQEQVTNLLHGTVTLKDARARSLLQLLDGTRDRQALAGELAQAAENDGLDDLLQGFGRMGLLLA